MEQTSSKLQPDPKIRPKYILLILFQLCRPQYAASQLRGKPELHARSFYFVIASAKLLDMDHRRVTRFAQERTIREADKGATQ